ncbi:MAG: UDP-N-acetylmuramoyl-tripeptide--D-alanyl-D-alanine ligase [Nocardioides sp.]|uniref:UDP-N-acetylmuramoyl-tripeptide--D-alanyl-D- alanine ligase n=1 Tax=Nocardioides sp. TaxID=35761 RepID=UPI003F000E8A
MTLTEIAEVVGGTAHGEATVTGPAFLDTRAAEPGGLFVALAGEHVDGHEYARAAIDGGAAAVLASRPTEGPTVVVDDVVDALGCLARHVLDQLPDVRVLAVTGSQGKTGVKDYLAQILEVTGETVATAGNHNNELGVPLTVLRVTERTAYLVVEMGARGQGHIAYLCKVAPPHVSCVVNVGSAHVGEFGGREAIARAKGEIVEALSSDGVAVLNMDDDLVSPMTRRTHARIIGFGSTAQVHANDVLVDDEGRCSFNLVTSEGSAPVHLRQIGRHQVQNALAATAMATALGVGLDVVPAALNAAEPRSRWRMERLERPDGLVVVNDAYNANPESVEAALRALLDLGRVGRRTVAVLGEMRELGPDTESGHLRVGRFAAEHGVDVVVAVGEPAAGIARGAESAVGWAGTAVHTAGRDEALEWLRQNVSAADVVLVKASRGAALEHIVEGLIVEGTTAP